MFTVITIHVIHVLIGIPSADFGSFKGAGLPNGRSVRTILLLLIKRLSDVFCAR